MKPSVNSLYLGIDPGVSGAMAYVRKSGQVAEVNALPTMKVTRGSELDLKTLRDMLMRNVHKTVFCCIEDVHSFPKQGVASTFKFGMAYGQLLGLLHGLRLRVYRVRPHEWRSRVLKGMPKGKDASIRYVNESQVGVDVGKNHNKADAICIAEYGIRTYA